MFSEGELVCYPMHGVGYIESVCEQTVLGETEQCYKIHFLHEKITAMLPVSRTESVGLRYPASADECEEMIAFMRDGNLRQEDSNWNRRYRDNLDLLQRGDILSVAEVVKSLASRDKGKGLSAGEKRMLILARKMLLTEMAVSMGKEEEEISKLING